MEPLYFAARLKPRALEKILNADLQADLQALPQRIEIEYFRDGFYQTLQAYTILRRVNGFQRWRGASDQKELLSGVTHG